MSFQCSDPYHTTRIHRRHTETVVGCKRTSLKQISFPQPFSRPTWDIESWWKDRQSLSTIRQQTPDNPTTTQPINKTYCVGFSLEVTSRWLQVIIFNIAS
ncbi:unnamed protein product [Orchesella dallaii]|uniref:Uncharacterized protein n=1 Tax=Orchesella dallaii TaxID=48710 RepID=A0ABP1QG25_9HEXA